MNRQTKLSSTEQTNFFGTRRHFLKQSPIGLGGIALSLMSAGSSLAENRTEHRDVEQQRAIAPRAKNVIYLHMAGSPSQLELFDYKPELKKLHMQPCPDELFKTQKFAFIKGHPKMLGPVCEFKQQGQSGAWVSDRIPHIASIVDDLTIVKSMVTDQFNHAPAQLFLLTGNARSGYPTMGSWVTYGLGSENADLPGFVVLVSGGNNLSAGKAAWGSGFLPGVYQGVQCRGVGDPILFTSDPQGMDRTSRRRSLDAINKLNELQHKEFHDPDTLTRIQQYELAYRMQVSVPDVMDIKHESKNTLEIYGAQPGTASFANNCLLARRLIEQGVRFVQLFDWGWDVHGTGSHDDLVTQFPKKCSEMDKPVAALISDLKQRGMLDDTLVIWGGEFGRTSMNEARGGSKFLGRDHHPHAFTMFFAGGGMKAGLNFGSTDDFGYFVTEDEVGVRDIQATILHQLGLDPFTHSFPFQGLNARLIGPTDEARVRKELII